MEIIKSIVMIVGIIFSVIIIITIPLAIIDDVLERKAEDRVDVLLRNKIRKLPEKLQKEIKEAEDKLNK